MIPCNSYYGGYRTRTLADIFPDEETFFETWDSSPFANHYGFLDEGKLNLIYYLLYARYGNSHIAYTDENQFTYSLLSTIFQYAPTWEKRLSIQDELRNLSIDELTKGGKAIYNHAYNPNTAPSTSTLEELLTINDQNTTNYKKSKMEGYAELLNLLETDVTGEFIDKFKKLFIVVTAPDYPLYYTTEVEEND